MAWFTYIVKCKNGTYYTGITWNLKKRIFEHNSRVKTSLQVSRLPVRLVFWEKFNSRIEAAGKEKKIKGWSRIKKEKLINSLH